MMSLLPLPGKRVNPMVTTEASSEAPYQLTVIQEFEQKIATELLKNAPVWAIVATLEERQQFANTIDRIINHSGLTEDLLLSDQQKALSQFKLQLELAKFETSNWRKLEHLSQLQLSSSPQHLDAITQNLLQQTQSNMAYPARFIQQAASLSSTTDNLNSVIASLDINANRWAQNRLDLVLTVPEQLAALPQLVEQRDNQRETVRALMKNSSQFYQNTYYDLRTESDPEQLTLDLLTLHLSEELASLSYQQNIAIEGLEYTIFSLYLLNNDQLKISLNSWLDLPGFEFQSIVRNVAGDLIANQHWPAPWHRSLGAAIGYWLETSESETALEIQIGSAVRQQLKLELAVAELELALKKTDIEQVQTTLSNELPYNDGQLSLLMTNWYAQQHSSTMSILMHREIKDMDKTQIRQLVESQAPSSYQNFKQTLAQQLTQ